MADDAYEVVRGSLKLKGVQDGGVKKKKKKNKAKKVLKQPLKQTNISDEQHEEVEAASKQRDKRTSAQISFDKMQEKRAAERILGKASQSHKERVAEFNTKLDNLTEHYDIPKVSWTK